MTMIQRRTGPESGPVLFITSRRQRLQSGAALPANGYAGDADETSQHQSERCGFRRCRYRVVGEVVVDSVDLHVVEERRVVAWQLRVRGEGQVEGACG